MLVPAHSTRIQPFTLRGYHGEPTAGTVTIHEFNREQRLRRALAGLGKWWGVALVCVLIPVAHFVDRSEEHTSELQSPCNLVCRLLLEKKKKKFHSLPPSLPELSKSVCGSA